MIGAGSARRGQPLLFLGVLLVGWLALRITTWEPPFDLRGALTTLDEGSLGAFGDGAPHAGERRADDARGSGLRGGAARDVEPKWSVLDHPLPGLIPAPMGLPDSAAQPGFDSPEPPPATRAAPAPGEQVQHSVTRMAVGHALLAMMGLSRLPLPPTVAAFFDLSRRTATGQGAVRLAQGSDAAPGPVAPVWAATSGTAARRWSADAWLLLREGGLRAPVAGQPSYGRSQAGAVLRYRLAPSSGHAPQAYVRASAALRSPRDAEVATGLSARPLAGVPVRVAAELRVADRAGGADLRPAAYAVTEFPPFDLPLGARGEFYAQGGYVGGDFATPFVDGQMRVTRDLASVGRTSLSAGAGAWGGAQKGAARLDVGPSAAVSFSLGEVYSRLSVDYRLRVAGDAEPRNGPALTLSAGF